MTMALRVLVADDERDCCDYLRSYLSRHGCVVDIAYDGRQAQDWLKTHKYDYIFVDCDMPELSGVEIIKTIDQLNPEARIIMISGYELINERFSRNLGVDAFLKKPFTFEAVQEIIENLGKR